MRQRCTSPLLAVILAAVLSRGKSFSQSLASHAICLPDTGMRAAVASSSFCCCCFFYFLPPSLSRHLLLSPGVLTSYFSPIITSPAPFFPPPSIHFLHLLCTSCIYILPRILLLTLIFLLSLTTTTSAHWCLPLSAERL